MSRALRPAARNLGYQVRTYYAGPKRWVLYREGNRTEELFQYGARPESETVPFSPGAVASSNPTVPRVSSSATAFASSSSFAEPPKTANSPAAFAKTVVSHAKVGSTVVGSHNDQSATARIAVVIPTGPRYESAEELGFAQLLKSYVLQNSKTVTDVFAVREAEAKGIFYHVDLTRENLILTGAGAKHVAGDIVHRLGDAVANIRFDDFRYRVNIDAVKAESAFAATNPLVLQLEALHQHAFRTGLGNPLFAPISQIGTLGFKNFAEYTKKAFARGVTVVGAGVNQDFLTAAVKSIGLPEATGSRPATKSAYFGGEASLPSLANDTLSRHILAFEGAAFGSADAVALQVLRGALGGESNVKYSTGGSNLGRVAAKHGSSANAFSFITSYADTGLFAIQTELTAGGDLTALARDAAAELKAIASGKISPELLLRAKKQAKLQLAADTTESHEGVITDLGYQLSVTGKFASFAESAAKIDSVTADTLSKLAAKLLKSKPTSVTYGNIAKAVYADQLSL